MILEGTAPYGHLLLAPVKGGGLWPPGGSFGPSRSVLDIHITSVLDIHNTSVLDIHND